jgi:hypothetical protein
VKTSTASSVDGYYLLAGLPVGSYNVTATLAGFQTVERTPIVVSTATGTTVDIELKPGKTTQVVTVHGGASQLDTTDAQVSTVVQESVVMDLPLQLGSSSAAGSGRRSIDDFIFLTPGVTGNAFSKSFNGSAGFEQEIIIDGATAAVGLSPGYLGGWGPPYESIQEFNVQNSMYPADYPLGFGVQNYTMKSGTNQLHGDAFEFVRNTDFESRPFFSSVRPITKQNEYAFTVGGPIVIPKVYNGNSRTFFFVGYSGFKLRSGATSSRYDTLPTVAMKQGDFSQLLPLGMQIYDPATTRPDGRGGFTRDPFPGNIIPTNRLDPAAVKYLSYAPDPDINRPYNNFLDQTRSPTNDWALSVKVDHSFSERQRVSFTHYWDYTDLDSHAGVPGALDNDNPFAYQGGGDRLSYFYTIRPNILNSLVLGYVNNTANRAEYPDQQVSGTVLKIPNLPPWPMLPSIYGNTFYFLGGGCCEPLANATREGQLRDVVGWTTGKHQFRFGTDIRDTSHNATLERQGGLFGISNFETSLPDSPVVNSLGWDSASLMLGQVDYSQLLRSAPRLGISSRFWSLFAQDDYRVSPKLTLNIGLAVDHPYPYSEKYHRMASLSLTTPNEAAGGILGAVSFAGFGPGRTNKNTFGYGVTELAPRLGLAYAINQKMVVRAGYGMYYAQGNGNAIDSLDVGNFLQGFAYPQTLTSPDGGITPAMTFSQGFATPPTVPNLDPTIANGGNVDYFNQAAGRSPTLQSWTFDVQRQLGVNTLLDVAYVGQQGYRLPGNLENLNQVNPKYLSLGAVLNDSISSPEAVAAGIPVPYQGFTGTVAQALRPYPQYTTINDADQPTGKSNYQGLQMKAQRRLSQGFNFLVSYTLSKTLGNSAQEGYASWAPMAMDTYHRSLAKAIAPGDQTHVLSISYVYELPFGPGKRFATTGGAIGKIVGGWEVTGIQSYASGTPIAVSGGGPIPLFGGGNAPNRIPGVPIRTSISGKFDPATDRYLNVNAFADPAPYTFGTVGPRLPNVRGFPSFNENIALLKDTHITESTYVQFRVETFNTFNRVVFSGPSTSIDSPSTYGVVSGTANSPRVVQFALKLIF